MTTIQEILLPAIEIELQHQIARLEKPRILPFQSILTYHMGWTGKGAGIKARGKRLRPLLVRSTCAGCEGEWEPALPAAACVELVHNFSLIHDDIQDNSATRRGRDTVWVKWGLPQAINAGDALFVLSNQALLDLTSSYSAEAVLKVAFIIQSTCLELTNGQFLDMSYENRTDIKVEDYWSMVSGKTAALISACCAIGSHLSGADMKAQDAYRNFGHYLGLAFQVQDDYLGIWGSSALTGKSTASDLVAGKKTLPVLIGLEKKGAFARRWTEGPILTNEVGTLADQLSKEGVRLEVEDIADQMSEQALQNLRTANPKGDAGEALFELVNTLLNRQN